MWIRAFYHLYSNKKHWMKIKLEDNKFKKIMKMTFKDHPSNNLKKFKRRSDLFLFNIKL